jgi:hypothetical protein
MEQQGPPLNEFLINLMFEDFSNTCHERSNLIKNLAIIKGGSTLHEFECTFMIIRRWILLRTRNVSDKSCRENQNTHFVFNNIFFFESLPVYELMWKKNIYWSRRGHNDNITLRMRFVCWITGDKNTRLEYAILFAFQRWQWLANVSHFTYYVRNLSCPTKRSILYTKYLIS